MAIHTVCAVYVIEQPRKDREREKGGTCCLLFEFMFRTKQEFKEDETETEDVCSFIISSSFNDFWCHIFDG